VINACLTACKRRSIDHYHKKTQSDINDEDTMLESDESENKDIAVSFIGIFLNIILRITIYVLGRIGRWAIAGSKNYFSL